MKRIGIFFIVTALLAAFPYAASAQMKPPSASSQQGQAPSGKEQMPGGQMGQMGSGMMQGGMPCMQMMQMMQKRMAGKDAQTAGRGTQAETGLSFFMEPFHRWMNLLMAHREVLELSPEQVGRLDAAVTEHLKSAVRGQADIQALMLDLKHSLRYQTQSLQPIEDLLKKISDQQLQLQIEGVRLYAAILNTILTEEQRTKTGDLIGGPFPPPWQEMPDMPSPHSSEGAASQSEGSTTGGKTQGGHP